MAIALAIDISTRLAAITQATATNVSPADDLTGERPPESGLSRTGVEKRIHHIRLPEQLLQDKSTPLLWPLGSSVPVTSPNRGLFWHASKGITASGCSLALARDGIESSRVQFVAKMPIEAYFELYQSIDIALDTFSLTPEERPVAMRLDGSSIDQFAMKSRLEGG